MNIFQDDFLSIEYQKHGNMLSLTWPPGTNTAEQYERGHQSSKELFDKTQAK